MTDMQPNRVPPRRKWKATSTIVEGRFHSARFFARNPIRFLTLVVHLGYDISYSFGSDPIPFEPRKVRQPNPPTGQVGTGPRSERIVAGERCRRTRRGVDPPEVSIGRYDDERSENVMILTPVPSMLVYVATGTRT